MNYTSLSDTPLRGSQNTLYGARGWVVTEGRQDEQAEKEGLK